MKENILQKVLLLAIVLYISVGHSFAISVFNPGQKNTIVADTVKKTNAQNRITGLKVAPKPESYLYKSEINKKFDFKVINLNKGIFAVNFVNETNSSVSIKIYDIIGNLVLFDEIDTKGIVNKKYNLSALKMNYFIIEVGNGKYNNSKKLSLG